MFSSSPQRLYDFPAVTSVPVYFSNGKPDPSCRVGGVHDESVKMESFKFKFVQDNSPKGFFSSKGAVTSGGLQLGDHLLPYGCVVDSTNRDTRLILQVDAASPEFPASLREKMWETSIVLEVSGASAEKLERHVDRYSSKIEAERYKEALIKEGRGSEYRVVECPCCAATVNLSEYPKTSFVYCRFCETVFGEGLQRLKGVEQYRECDECGFHDRVQGYGEFYFYFLLVVYGFSHKRRHMCDA